MSATTRAGLPGRRRSRRRPYRREPWVPGQAVTTRATTPKWAATAVVTSVCQTSW